MADNTTLNAGSGGDTIATDDILGVKYQRVKITLGADGTAVDAVAGAGAVSSAVQRVTLASDDPAVTALQLLDNAISGAGFNITQLNGVNVTMGNGASGTGVIRMTLASDSTGNIATIGTSVTPGTAAANLGKAVDAVAGATDTGVMGLFVRQDTLSSLTPVVGDYSFAKVNANGAQWVQIAGGSIAGIVDDAAFTAGTSEVLPIGFVADESATDSVNEDDCGAARMTLDRKQIVTLYPHTAGGLSTAAGSITTTVTSVKGSAGQIYGWHFYNPNASAVYVQIFDAATGSVTLGTTTPKMSLGIPASSGATLSVPQGIAFATAISIAITTTRTGSTAPGSSVDYNFTYA